MLSLRAHNAFHAGFQFELRGAGKWCHACRQPKVKTSAVKSPGIKPRPPHGAIFQRWVQIYQKRRIGANPTEGAKVAAKSTVRPQKWRL
jgi:hypothetical protein